MHGKGQIMLIMFRPHCQFCAEKSEICVEKSDFIKIRPFCVEKVFLMWKKAIVWKHFNRKKFFFVWKIIYLKKNYIYENEWALDKTKFSEVLFRFYCFLVFRKKTFILIVESRNGRWSDARTRETNRKWRNTNKVA